MRALTLIFIAFCAGIGFWISARALGAENPSLNGIVYGGFFAIILLLNDLITEIKKK